MTARDIRPTGIDSVFEGVSADSPDERIREIAPDFPVFRIVP